MGCRQRAIEFAGGRRLAALNSTTEDHARLRDLIADAERRSDDVCGVSRGSGREFHLAGRRGPRTNRVLVVQLISLQHVSWAGAEPDPDADGGAAASSMPIRNWHR